MSAAGDIAELAGRVTFYLILIGVAVGLGFYLARRHPQKRFTWWPIAVIALLLVASMFGRISNNLVAASPNASGEPLPPMYVQKRVGRNFAGQNIRLTSDLLPFQEADARKYYFKKLEAQNFSEAEMQTAKIKSELLRIGKNSVIRTTFQMPGRLSIREFLGILEDMETTVICVQEGTDSVLFNGTPCEREVRDVFGPSAIEVVK